MPRHALCNWKVAKLFDAHTNRYNRPQTKTDNIFSVLGTNRYNRHQIKTDNIFSVLADFIVTNLTHYWWNMFEMPSICRTDSPIKMFILYVTFGSKDESNGHLQICSSAYWLNSRNSNLFNRCCVQFSHQIHRLDIILHVLKWTKSSLVRTDLSHNEFIMPMIDTSNLFLIVACYLFNDPLYWVLVWVNILFG